VIRISYHGGIRKRSTYAALSTTFSAYASYTFVIGIYQYASAALPALVKAKGQIIIVTAGAAHLRFPNSSDYLVRTHPYCMRIDSYKLIGQQTYTRTPDRAYCPWFVVVRRKKSAAC
jgi:hypothetical protein